ncbi:mitochondrial carrier domain-containing protein [Ochromonadaceae sp. CCMP2298]|nr:mitochondrial carrier domain-containing protein [Ochromonadaceae sp. CCMP2298]
MIVRALFTLLLACNLSLVWSITPVTARFTLLAQQQREGQNCVACSALAGAFGCSVTHSLVTPLDVVKTRLQSLGSGGVRSSTWSALRDIVRRDGVSAIFTGVKATACGYFLQGAFKFGFYDYFKGQLQQMYPPTHPHSTHSSGSSSSGTHSGSGSGSKIPILLAASALAEVIASLSLCPLEATKIYMVTHPEIAAQGLFYSIKHLLLLGGVTGLYRGLPWVLLRQVPYTCVKLAGYDTITTALRHRYKSHRLRYDDLHMGGGGGEKGAKGATGATGTGAGGKGTGGMETTTGGKGTGGKGAGGKGAGAKGGIGGTGEQQHDVSLTPAQSLGLQLLGGVTAGLLAAVISQPADVILSKVCSAGASSTCLVVHSPAALLRLVEDLGWGCMAGLPERALMVSSMTAMQFVVYENTKTHLCRAKARHQVLSENKA